MDNNTGVPVILTILTLILGILKLVLEILKTVIELLEKVKSPPKPPQPRKHKRKE